MRKIVVGGQAYWWSYRTVRDVYCRSKLTLITENRTTKWIVQFTTVDTITAGSPLNEGLRVIKEGQPYALNLNQPKYVAEVLQHVLDMGLNTSAKSVHELNGNDLLAGMGYQDTTGMLI
ncbi:hypothetical protein [Paenibacillus piscarius]|uniref:hypothetical protein n=1 Tax=Paenibacillus piscarius TaxID=1089681 RepID=UPI001EE8F8B7|nr:hypothetical protein [Paenibacillus piscarius]